MDHDAFQIRTRRHIEELLAFKEKLEPLIDPLTEFLAQWKAANDQKQSSAAGEPNAVVDESKS
jgi:hypothetical protein